MGRKRKVAPTPDPYLVQQEPLTVEQLCHIFESGFEECSRFIVPHVPHPQAGQVFLIDCASARFARYDAHRWTCHHHHTGLHTLWPAAQDPFGDQLEVRYNKKCGTHPNLSDNSLRIVYKVNATPPLPFHVVQYVEGLPSEVEARIRAQQEEQERKLQELARKKEEENRRVEKVAGVKNSASSYGRQRRPNSRYTELYKVESAAMDFLTTTSKEEEDNDVKEEEEEEEDDEEEEEDGYKEPKGSGRGRGGIARRRGESYHGPGSKVWMAGYGSERSKPKSSSLFRMCASEEEEEEECPGKEVKQAGHQDKHTGDKGADCPQLIRYSEDIPTSASVSEKVLTVAEVMKIIENVVELKMAVYSSVPLLPKMGEIFVLHSDVGEGESKVWEAESRYHHQLGVTVTRHNKTVAPQPLSPDTSHLNVRLTYQSDKHPQFHVVQYLSSAVLGSGAPVSLHQDDNPTADTKFDTTDSDTVVILVSDQGKASASQIKNESCGESRLQELESGDMAEGDKTKNEVEEEGRRKDYAEGEARPFRIVTHTRLHHLDAEQIFAKAINGEMEVYKTEIKTPQYGDMYLLDKSFVPFSDSLPWVREYYYKSSSILMERFVLRDTQMVFSQPLPPSCKTVFTQHQHSPQLCIIHYEHLHPHHGRTLKRQTALAEGREGQPGIYTESNANLNLSLVCAMLTNPDQSRITNAPILNPKPFQVYLLRLPPDTPNSKVVDNYQWTDKGFKRWPTDGSSSDTKLLCYHCPMKMPRSAMCTALMRHEFKHVSASPNLRVVHYMPTREFREYIVIANAAKQLEAGTEASRRAWPQLELECEVPMHVSCQRLRPVMVWDLLSRSIGMTSGPGVVTMEILAPQPGGVYLSTKYAGPDVLQWEELARLQVQPRLYQLVEVCERVSQGPACLLRLCYTSPKVPHKVLVHYLGDPWPHVVRECDMVMDDYTGEPCYRPRHQGKKQQPTVPPNTCLVEDKLYRISSQHLQAVGCVPLQLEDLEVAMDPSQAQLLPHSTPTLLPPEKPGLYLYSHRMTKKRIIRILECLDRSKKVSLPIKNPEAGEAYLVAKPASTKTAIDSYKWTQKGWQGWPRRNPALLWRWGLLRHKKQTWAPPLIRIDYLHLSTNTDLLLVHYTPTRDNDMMLEIKSAIVPIRLQTHTLLSLGDVNFGQHSQLLTNSPLPPSHVWQLLSATGGLNSPVLQPQPGAVYVINLDTKERLDYFRWKTLGDVRLSSNDYGLVETTCTSEWEPADQFARLTYHSPLIKNRTVIHYLGDCRPFLDRAKLEEDEQQWRLEHLRKKCEASLEEEGGTSHLCLQDVGARDSTTQAVGSILADLGSSVMDSNSLNQTFNELGEEGLCGGGLEVVTPRPEDQHLLDDNLPPLKVVFGSVSTASMVKQLFPQGLPKITIQKVLEVEPEEYLPKKRRPDNIIELPSVTVECGEERKVGGDSYRAVPRTIQDWHEEEESEELETEPLRRTRLQITTTEPRTIVYLRQQGILTEKQLDHMLSNPDLDRISFLPLLDPQPGDVFVVAIPYRKGEVRRLDCCNWYVTGHKKGKFRRTYSYIREPDGNTSHRLLRYTYDYAWESCPGLRVVHYIAGDPNHQVQCSGKKPNYEEEPEEGGCGPLYRAYTAPMTHRDVLLIINDPPLYHLCSLPIINPKAGDVYLIQAPAVSLAKREALYDNLTWAEGQVKHIGGKRPVVRKTKYLSLDPTDRTKSDAFVRVTWERMASFPSPDLDIPSTRKKETYIIIHYLGDETMAGEMVRKGKDGALHLRQINHYLETGQFLPSVHMAERNGIRKSAKKFLMKDHKMYYIGKTGIEKRLVLYTNEEKNKAFEDCHIYPKTGEHCGRTKTLRRLAEKFYWTSMVEDVVAMIVRCKTCEFSKLNRPNQRFVRVTEPWEVVSIDVIGQFVTSEHGNIFLAVITDMFTKYTMALPLRDTTVADLAAAIQTAVYQQGPPRKFVSDQSEDFIKELNLALELDMGLCGNVLCVSKTQINRPDEATIKTTLLHHCLEAGSLWDQLLQKKVYEINTTHTTACGQTPFFLMFHRHVRAMDGNAGQVGSGSGRPTFVVRDIERYMEERERKATDIISQVLSVGEERTTPAAGVVAGAEESVEELSTNLLEAVADAGYQGGVQVVAPDPDHDHYTHMLPSHTQVVDEGGGSVYEMGDGEGQVVVVADGMLGGAGGEVAGQHMVVVQPGGGDQGLVMLSENQVIMEAVEGPFTYSTPDT